MKKLFDRILKETGAKVDYDPRLFAMAVAIAIFPIVVVVGVIIWLILR